MRAAQRHKKSLFLPLPFFVLSIFFLSFLLAGCAVGKAFQKPQQVAGTQEAIGGPSKEKIAQVTENMKIDLIQKRELIKKIEQERKKEREQETTAGREGRLKRGEEVFPVRDKPVKKLSPKSMSRLQKMNLPWGTNTNAVTGSITGYAAAEATPAAWKQVSEPGFGQYNKINAFYNENNEVLRILTVTLSGLHEWRKEANQWKEIGKGMLPYPELIYDAQIDPGDINHYFVLDKYTLHETYDAGKTWKKNTDISKLFYSKPTPYKISRIHLFDSQHILLYYVDQDGKGHIFISSNAGKNWAISASGLIGTPAFNKDGGVTYRTLTSLYLSTDYGKTWKKIKDLTDISPESGISFALADDLKTIYIVQAGKTGTLFKSSDSGVTWEKSEFKLLDHRHSQALIINPKNFNHLMLFQYMAGPYESKDGGKSWSHLYTGFDIEGDLMNVACISPHDGNVNEQCTVLPRDLRDFLADPNFNMYWASDQGLFVMVPPEENDKTMILINIAKSLSFDESYDVQADACGNIYYGVWHSGPAIKTKTKTYLLDVGEVEGFVLEDSTSCMPKALQYTYQYYPPDSYLEGLNVHKFGKKMPLTKPVYFNDKLYWVDAQTLFSTDEKISAEPKKVFLKSISSIFKNYEGTLLFAFDADGGLLKTSNGMNWETIINADETPLYFLKGSAAGNTIALITENPENSEKGIKVSIDNGKSWGSSSSSYLTTLAPAVAADVLVDPNCPQRLYALTRLSLNTFNDWVTQKSIMVSYDAGNSWSEFGTEHTGLTSLFFGDIYEQKLYIATEGRGLWEASLKDLPCFAPAPAEPIFEWITITQQPKTKTIFYNQELPIIVGNTKYKLKIIGIDTQAEKSIKFSVKDTGTKKETMYSTNSNTGLPIMLQDKQITIKINNKDSNKGLLFDVEIKLTGAGGTVAAPIANTPPVLASIGSKSGEVNKKISFTIYATDADKDMLFFSFVPGLSLPGVMLNKNADGTATFAWTPTGKAGIYPVGFKVSDGKGGEDTEQITITVTAAPSANQPPVLEAIGKKDAQVGAEVKFTLKATDADKDMLFFSFVPGLSPPGAMLTKNADGIITFTWTPKQKGTQSVGFKVTDSKGGEDTETVSFIVTEAAQPNYLPVIAPLGNKEVQLNTNLIFIIKATDANNDKLTFSILSGFFPLGAKFTNNNDGTATFAWTPTGKAGIYPAGFKVSDGKGGEDKKIINITVT